MRRFIGRHQRLSVLIVILVPVLMAVAGWHYYTLYGSLRGARESLLQTQSRLSDVGLNLSDGDIAVAREQLGEARADLNRAQGHLKWDPFVQASRLVPLLDTQVSAANDLLEMADILIQIGDRATTAGAKAVALRERPPEGQALTQALVGLLDDTGPDVDHIGALTTQLVAMRLKMGDEALIPPLNNVRERIDKELPRLANAVEQARQSKSLLPVFLGFKKDRNYLVFALNSGELLPGGGLVTAAGILPVSKGVNGKLEFKDSVLWKDAAEKKGIPYITPPGPLKRYLLRDYTWNLLVSNWDPDFPTWSQQAREFYELVNGKQQVDGIIAVDLVVLERLLQVTGPKTLDIPGRGPTTFDSANAVLLLEELTRPAFEKPQEERKSVIGDLAQTVMADLLKLPSNRWADAVDIIRKLGVERHIQVLAFDPAEQTAIRDFGWDGRLRTDTPDFFQFNEASLLSTKLNLILKPEASLDLKLNQLGDVEHELTVTYNNTFPEWAKGKDPKLVNDLMYGGLYGGYLRVFGPHDMASESIEIDGQPAGLDAEGRTAAADWFAAWMPVPGGVTRQAVFRWKTTPATSVTTNGYELHIQKQPGTDGMCIKLNIGRDGKAPKDLRVTGGKRLPDGRICLTTDVTITARW